jgi:HEAT repeat protein
VSWLRRRRGTATSDRTGVDDQVVDGLTSADPGVRAASARSCGVARLEAAVPLLAERLLDPDPRVRGAAAGALGRIGGARSADALLRALRARRVPASRLIRELARSAPDLYLEAALAQPENRQLRAALAVAAGLRPCPTPIARMLYELLDEGVEGERIAACHAFGALGYTEAVPVLLDALFDRSPAVRQAARGALNRLGARVPGSEPPRPAPRVGRRSPLPLPLPSAWRGRR